MLRLEDAERRPGRGATGPASGRTTTARIGRGGSGLARRIIRPAMRPRSALTPAGALPAVAPPPAADALDAGRANPRRPDGLFRGVPHA